MNEIANIYLRELLNNKQIDIDCNICLATGEKCAIHYQPTLKRIVFSAYGSDFELTISQDLITPLLFDLNASTLNGNRVYYITIHNQIFALRADK